MYGSADCAALSLPPFPVDRGLGCCRDFNEGDYEALLLLDTEVADTRPLISDAALRTLQTHVHMCGKAVSPGSDCKPGKDTSVFHKVRTLTT